MLTMKKAYNNKQNHTQRYTSPAKYKQETHINKLTYTLKLTEKKKKGHIDTHNYTNIK